MAGFATVSLQMRGTGCSGGAFDLFGYPSDYDAYDAIEIVAHQSWVANHKVGMVGISYSGLSQFPAAGTDPPGLAAIAPMSPTDDLFSTGYPGGIYNDGFAASWVGARIDDAMAAAAYSDGRLVPALDHPGRRRGPAVDLLRDRRGAGGERRGVVDLPGQPGPPRPVREPGRAWSVRSWWRRAPGPGRDPSLFDRRSMSEWATPHHGAGVPVGRPAGRADRAPVAGAASMRIPKTTPVYANMVNGGHIDSTDPQTISRWLEFLDIYVADKVPTEPERPGRPDPRRVHRLRLGDLGPGAASGHPVHRCADRGRGPGRVRGADAPGRVLFDNGAGAVGAGAIRVDVLGRASPAGHPPGTVDEALLRPTRCTGHRASRRQASTTLHPGPDGAAPDQPACRRQCVGGRSRRGTGPRSRRTDGIAFQTAPFTTATTIVGPATLDLWVKSSDPGGGLPGHHHRGPAVRRHRRSTSRRASCVARTRSTCPTRPRLFTDPNYTGRGTPQTCRRRRTRW